MIGVAVAAAGCGGGTGPAPTPTGSGSAGLTRCEPEPRPPVAFDRRSAFTVEEADHVGVRATYRDPRGRKLVVASGITGEFGEGQPSAGTVPLAGGGQAQVLGVGRAWTAVWAAAPPCATRAIIGHGFDRAGFVRVLQRMGVVASTG